MVYAPSPTLRRVLVVVPCLAVAFVAFMGMVLLALDMLNALAGAPIPLSSPPVFLACWATATLATHRLMACAPTLYALLARPVVALLLGVALCVIVGFATAMGALFALMDSHGILAVPTLEGHPWISAATSAVLFVLAFVGLDIASQQD